MKSRKTFRLLLMVAGLAAIVVGWYLTKSREVAPTPARQAAKPAPKVEPPVAAPPATKGDAPAPTALARTSGEPAAPAQASLPPAPTVAPTAPLPQAAFVVPLAAPEELATERMITAHAPLRTPAVANPDSPENHKALQAMLVKALQRKEGPPPK